VSERILHQYSYEGKVPGPEGNRHPFLAPFGLVPAKDGVVALACHADEFWAKLTQLMGRPDMGVDPRFATREGRHAHQEEIYREVSAFTRRHTRRELMAILGGHVPFGPVFDVSDIAADPHFAARDMVVALDHPGSEGKRAVAGVPVRLSETPGGIRRRAPLLGEDTDEVLGEAGLSASAITQLRADGIVI
jgi:crotonobetainyl-CoA:carnitine CoA-transferase CaiB-like acyl-CoA transferase